MRVTEELRALVGIVDRLAEKFPGVPRETIEDVVQQEHRALDEGRVRDFVPVLVERAARARLTRNPVALLPRERSGVLDLDVSGLLLVHPSSG